MAAARRSGRMPPSWRGDTALNSLRCFIDQTIEHGADLVLPMHGGPVPLGKDTQTGTKPLPRSKLRTC